MKKLMFIVMCISLIFTFGCNKENTENLSSDLIASKLVNDPNYIAFQEFNDDVFGKFIQKNQFYS